MGMVTRKRAITVIAVAMSFFHLYTAGFRLYPAIQQRTTHLVFVLMLVFLFFPLKKGSSSHSVLSSEHT
ncbi:MAG: transporter, fusion protein [Deltaproteobacteria bacterium]|nr:transporter, fusion protein [Deltaproteobacteria bacterium]